MLMKPAQEPKTVEAAVVVAEEGVSVEAEAAGVATDNKRVSLQNCSEIKRN